MMDSRVVNQIEEFYRQDAKFTERKEESLREKLQVDLASLCELGVLAVKFFD
jgi:hypothetical protein